MWRVVSAYVVDQKGARWFWGALFFSCILGLGFRATFSAGRVERELRFAFAKLEPQLKLKFEKADLVVANHLGLPAILLKISDVTGFYLPDYRWMKPIRLTTNQVELPISLFELMRGRAALNEVRLGDLEIIVPEQLLSVLWQFVSFQDQQIKDSHVSNGYDLNHEIGNKSDERSQFEVTKPHPVERVTVESIRIKGLPLSDVSITFRDVSVEITEQGRLTSQSHVVFRMGKNIEYRNIFLLINYDPQDQFLMASISGRLREGLLNGRFHWDQLRQSFYTEAKIDSAPMRALEQFLALGSSPSSTPFAFLNRLGRSIQKESWVSFNLSGFGYFGEAKNDLQLILGNFSLSSQNESLLIARLNYVYQLGEGRVEPFSVTFKGFPTDRFWSIFFPNYDSMAAALKDGRLNGVVQLNRDRVLLSQFQSDVVRWVLGAWEVLIDDVEGDLSGSSKDGFEFRLKGKKIRDTQNGDMFFLNDGIIQGQFSSKRVAVKSFQAQLYQVGNWYMENVQLFPLQNEVRFNKLLIGKNVFLNGFLKKSSDEKWLGQALYEIAGQGKTVKVGMKSDNGRQMCFVDLSASIKKELSPSLNESFCFDFGPVLLVFL